MVESRVPRFRVLCSWRYAFFAFLRFCVPAFRVFPFRIPRFVFSASRVLRVRVLRFAFPRCAFCNPCTPRLRLFSFACCVPFFRVLHPCFLCSACCVFCVWRSAFPRYVFLALCVIAFCVPAFRVYPFRTLRFAFFCVSHFCLRFAFRVLRFALCVPASCVFAFAFCVSLFLRSVLLRIACFAFCVPALCVFPGPPLEGGPLLGGGAPVF